MTLRLIGFNCHHFPFQISDFGMTRDLEDEPYYVVGGARRIPLKWTAPEALMYKKYSTSSDVWSYGMLMYEIWSVGHKPYEKLAIEEVSQKWSLSTIDLYCTTCAVVPSLREHPQVTSLLRLALHVTHVRTCVQH